MHDNNVVGRYGRRGDFQTSWDAGKEYAIKCNPTEFPSLLAWQQWNVYESSAIRYFQPSLWQQYVDYVWKYIVNRYVATLYSIC